MSPNLTQREFSKHVNTHFYAGTSDGTSAKLELVQVRPYRGNEPKETGMERFSAFFVGPNDSCLEQQTYQMQHDQMGKFDLFLVPISQDDAGCRYEAVFNYYLDNKRP
jgi:hypothetical protein